MPNTPAGVVMLDLIGHELTPEEREILLHPQVGGVIFFSRNYDSPAQLAELSLQIKSLRPNLVIGVDQEGGRVQRFKEGFTRIPAMQALVNSVSKSADGSPYEFVEEVAWLLASELRALHVDFSFGPVLDLDKAKSRVIGDRSFSLDPNVASACGRAYINGARSAGMASVGKHFPGHGGIVEDTHLEKAVDDRPFEILEKNDLLPFANLIPALDGVMPAHVIFSEVDENPVGYSSQWLGRVLRKELGFKGLVFSDDLSMAGASFVGGYPERAEAAIAAGCDAVLVCNQPAEAIAVLEHLERRLPARVSGLERMLKWQKESHASTLTALKKNSRWGRCVSRLKAMEDNVGNTAE